MQRKAKQNKNVSLLGEIESKELLRQAGIAVNETVLAASEAEVISLAQRFGFPVVLKIASSHIVHKSDAGGVRLGLNNTSEVVIAYHEILSSVRSKCPSAAVDGVSV